MNNAVLGSPTPECLNRHEHIEALYDLPTAAQLIPLEYLSLRRFLSRHKRWFPARYRRYRSQDQIPRRTRVLTALELRWIRSHYLYGPGAADVVTPCPCDRSQRLQEKQKRPVIASRDS